MQTNAKTSIRTASISTAITAAIALVAVSVSVQAGEIDSQRHRFEIPSESLNAALTAFSDQSHMHVVTSRVPAGALSPGVSGDLSTVNALTALLRGTGLSFRQVDAETIVVVPAAMATLRPTQFQLVGDVPQDALAVAPTAAAAAAPEAQALTEVQVTGTRIIRQGYEAPTPVTAVGIQDLQSNVANSIGDTLTELPAFQGNLTFANQNTMDNESAQTELNLRNLTASRTLILFDGRRLPTANQEDVPDLDLIPDALVQRVDVVTGGASAVYGSDAIAGVVNYILDTNFTGFKGEVQGGESGYGDGASEKVSLTLGTTFADGRLHLLLSGDQRQQATIQDSQRPWGKDDLGESLIQNPAYVTNKNVPEYLWESCCVSAPGEYPGGIILSGPLEGTAFGVGGTPFQFNYGTGLTTAGNEDSGGDWQSTVRHESLEPMSAATHFFARVGFDITPSNQVYAEWLEGNDHTIDLCCYDYYPTGIGTLYTNNPYIPQQTLAAAAAATPAVTSFTVGNMLEFPTSYGIDGGLGVDDFRYTDAYVLGLRGQFNIGKNSYNYNLYGQQGTSVQQFAIVNESIKTNLSDAIEAVTVGSYGGNTATTSPAILGDVTTAAPYTAANFPNPLGIAKGTITCASNLLPLNNPNETTNCVPFNVFGLGQMSQAAINYTQAQGTLREVGQQSIVGGSITGEPFSDWAGPVSVALDAEYRHEAIGGFGDPISATTGFFSTNFFPYFGSQEVTEGAVEAVVPLLKSMPAVQELDFNGAARATDYSTSGFVTTYKLGLEYTPINELRFRGTYSEDIRAPNLFNLFGYSNGHGSSTDPFMNNASEPSYGITIGNPNLKAEKAHQYELGLVFQPSEIPGLNLSVDYYHIKIAEAIGTIESPLTACFATRIGSSLTGTSPECLLIARNPNGTLYSVTSYSINQASFLASGVDYAGDYRKSLTELISSWKGTVDLHLTATQTQHDLTNSGIAGPTQILEAVGTGNVPRWAVFGTLTYDLDPWRFAWTERYVSSTLSSNTAIVCSTNCPNPVPAGFSTYGFVPRVPTYFIANLAVQYKFMEHDQQEAEAFVNVNNVFNKIPPFNYLIGGGESNGEPTNETLFDVIGLYVRAGIRFRF